MAKTRVRVVTSQDQQFKQKTQRKVISTDQNPKVPSLTANEKRARRFATTTSMGFGTRTANDIVQSAGSNFYSPQLSTDFLEKPQNLRERRAFYRFFYNTNEIIGQAIDIHSTLPLSKLRLVPPKGKNKHQNDYIFKFYKNMCDEMKLFKTLIEITHEYFLFGNCLLLGTDIRTFEGIKKIEDIKPGDKVLTHKKRWRSVEAVSHRKVNEILRIETLKSYKNLNATSEHPIEVYTKKGFEFIKAKDIKVGDYIRITWLDGEDPPSKFSKKSTDYLNVNGEIALKVKSIVRESGDFDVYNLQVEEDNTYQANGYSTHNCFIFCEDDDWRDGINSEDIGQKKEEAKQRAQLLKDKYDITDKNPLYKGWKKLLILPPDQVRVRKLPLTDDVAIEYMPDPETRKFLTSDIPIDPQDPTKRLDYSISQELREKVRQSGVIPLDTDPYTGSHVFHLARKKSQYEPLGVSMIERCINTLVLMDKLRQAQTSIASRHMTPMRVVWAEELNSDDVDNLREQVDLALVDPDFSIIANYEIHWEEMGSNGRLLDVETEMESSLNRLFAGLGVTREMLTGEGTYTGSRVSLEIMNTMYLLFREVIQDYIENNLFKPVAKKKGFIEHDKYGNEILLYPKVSFTRLAIRDNEQFFDAAFQLYQKGSISIDLILDILNIDPDATREKIEKDLFTVNDSLFNEMMRNLYTNVAAPLVEQTNIADKLAEYLKLQKVEQAPPAEGESRFSSVEGDDRKQKIAKLMKYFVNNPQVVDKIFIRNNGELIPKQARESRCIVRSQK